VACVVPGGFVALGGFGGLATRRLAVGGACCLAVAEFIALDRLAGV